MRRAKTNVLCFTTSYKRPYYLYHTINSILNQEYNNIHYSIGLSVDSRNEQDKYLDLLSTFIKDKRLTIHFHSNLNQHDNYLYPIKQTNFEKYDIFIKIDDDDIYKREYISKMVSIYKKANVDILSANIKYQLNNNNIYAGKFDNVGGYWHEDLKSKVKFGMPFTYVFNNKALGVLLNTSHEELRNIHPFEDAGWRRKWRENNIKSKVLDNIDFAIYNIHGNNISSKHCLIQNNEDDDKYYIDTNSFGIAFFEHYGWQSYCFMDKRNHKLFNIENNHYGKFSIDQTVISIKWENYGFEKFKLSTNNIYKYIT